MTGMVAHASQPFDDRCHAWQRPKVGTEPLRPRPSAQGEIDPPQLLAIELWLPAGPTDCFQCTDSAPAPLLIPTADTLAADLQDPGHRSQDFAGTEQTRRMLAPIFQGLEIPSRTDGLLHAPIMHETPGVVTVLCEIH